MTKAHPMTGCSPTEPRWPIRAEDTNTNIGKFGPVRRRADGSAKMHKGIDYEAEPGAPIFAAHDGWIRRGPPKDGEESGGGGYGQRLYLSSHDEAVETIYAHLSGELVAQSDNVRAGALLGWVGRSGNIGLDAAKIKSHIHFEVRVDGQPLDPDVWLYS